MPRVFLARACRALAIPLAVLFAVPGPAAAQDAPQRSLGMVTVGGGQPTSLPTEVPATMEGVTREQIERSINATDASDALRYLPSLLVRKRYAGDFNHAILSSRASGTGNSARSLVYADGILLSNLLGNGVGGLSFPPRWGLVSPAEIERVDVLYGPYSAAYPGNSLGAVVDYTTRMPTRLEGHVQVGTWVQPFTDGGTDATYRSWQASTALGSRAGDWSWRLDLNRLDSEGQPLTFATRTVAAGTAVGAGVPVTGAVRGTNAAGQPWWTLGTGTQYATRQDQLKARLAYDFSPTLRAAYTLGWWDNTAASRPASWLRDAAGVPVAAGPVRIDGLAYAPLTGADFPLADERQTHVMHGVHLRRRTQGAFDWSLSASVYDYARDQRRQNGAAATLPGALDGGPGTLADGGGTGWNALSARGTWRPGGDWAAHVVDAGVQQDRFVLSFRTSALADWRSGAAGALASEVGGRTQLRSLWAQDAWRFAPGWKSVAGLRAEHWTAQDGRTRIPGATPAVDAAWAGRSETAWSPKLALSWQARPDLAVKAAAGRAVRFPTVAELYGATSTVNAQFVNDPLLRPERAWSGELSLQQDLGSGLVRLTWFAEDTRDAIYNQTVFDAAANRNVSRVQNVGRVATQGLELAWQAVDLLRRGLDLSGSLTWADSVIRENAGFVSVPGDTLGKRQPNVARLRASLLADWRIDERWSASAGARYSGRQFRTLDNSDTNGSTYMGVSPFLIVDLRARLRIDRRWSVAAGIDNAGNRTSWNFHPYPQRTYFAELRADL